MKSEPLANDPNDPSNLLGAIQEMARSKDGDGRVHRLAICEYDRNENWQTYAILNPPWSEIEAAIRKLDRRLFPFVTIYLNEKEGGEEGVHYFCVMGGDSEYAMFGAKERLTPVTRYFDPTRSEHEEVWVWTTDQGAVYKKCYLCNDVARVLQISRYFAETGEFDPSASWVDRR